MNVEFLDLTTRVVQMAKCVEELTLLSVFMSFHCYNILHFLPGDS